MVLYAGKEKKIKGVGLILDKHMKNIWDTVNCLTILLKLKGKPFNISIIFVYAPTKQRERN